MPQMAPLWWELLFLIFIITFMIMNTMNYFLYINNYKKNYINKNMMSQMNWKW